MLDISDVSGMHFDIGNPFTWRIIKWAFSSDDLHSMHLQIHIGKSTNACFYRESEHEPTPICTCPLQCLRVASLPCPLFKQAPPHPSAGCALQ